MTSIKQDQPITQRGLDHFKDLIDSTKVEQEDYLSESGEYSTTPTRNAEQCYSRSRPIS